VEIAADGAHDDLTRVQADADLDDRRVGAAHLVRVHFHALLHPERRVAGPHGVIFVGEGRAEEGHDPVAHDLVDGALVAVDGLHHPFEHGVEDLARLFGITVGEQLHRALEVGEEHGHLLAFAFQRGLRREDFLGEMLGRVGRRNVEPRPLSVGCRTSLGHPLTALLAELGAQLVCDAASRTGRLKA
jgi:hypothetical protein